MNHMPKNNFSPKSRLHALLYSGTQVKDSSCTFFYKKDIPNSVNSSPNAVGFAPGDIKLYTDAATDIHKKPTFTELFLYASGKQLARDHMSISHFLQSPEYGKRTLYIPTSGTIEEHKRAAIMHIRTLSYQTLLTIPGALTIAVALDAITVHTPPGAETAFALVAGPIIVGRSIFRLRKARRIIVKNQCVFKHSTYKYAQLSDAARSVTTNDPKLSFRIKEIGMFVNKMFRDIHSRFNLKKSK